MEKITLTGVWRNDRQSKEGKPYVSVSVKCREYGDKYLSGFGSAWNANWKEGDVVEIEKTTKPGKDKNGNIVEYLNFTKPDPMAELSKAVFRHEREIQELKKAIAGLQRNEPDDLEVINAELAGSEPQDAL